MAIPDSGAPYVWTQLDASSKVTLLVALKDALIASGWTLAQSTSSTVTLTFSGLPLNNETCAFDGQTYKFVAVLNQLNAREVLIGADAAACASNLADAINEAAGTKGTAYSNATTAHPTCTAEDTAGACCVSGPAVGFGASESLSNATLNRTTAIGYGYKLDSARCPSGLQMRLMIDDDGVAGAIRLRVASCDEAIIQSNQYRLATTAGRMYQLCGCKHQIGIWLLGSWDNYTSFFCGTLAQESHTSGAAVESVSDNGGKFQLTTGMPHGLATGDQSFVAGGTKDSGTPSAVNGQSAVAVLDSNNVVLEDSTYAAENYDTNSARIGATLVGIASRCFWAQGQTDYSADARGGTFRAHDGYNTTWMHLAAHSVCYNEYAYSVNRDAKQCIRLKRSMANNLNTVESSCVLDAAGRADLIEAQVCWPLSSPWGTLTYFGRLWNTFCLERQCDPDKPKRNLQGFNWINAMVGNSGFTLTSLWMATGPAA